MTTFNVTDSHEIEVFANKIRDAILNSHHITASNRFAGDVRAPTKSKNFYQFKVGFTPDAFKTLIEALDRPFIMIFFDKKEKV